MTLFETSYSMKSLILILIALGLLSFSVIQKYSKYCFTSKAPLRVVEVHDKKTTNNKISTHTYTSSHIQIAYIYWPVPIKSVIMFPIQNLDFSFFHFFFFCGLNTILLTLLNFQISDENKNSVPLRFFGGNFPVITCDSVRNIFYAGIHLWWTNLNTISRLPIILIVVKAVYSHPIYIWWLPNNGPGATEPPENNRLTPKHTLTSYRVPGPCNLSLSLSMVAV